MSNKIKKYKHNARVLCGAEANKLMHRIMKLYTYSDSIKSEAQFNVVAKHLSSVEHDFAMLGYMAREDSRELYVRSSEYSKLRARTQNSTSR